MKDDLLYGDYAGTPASNGNSRRKGVPAAAKVGVALLLALAVGLVQYFFFGDGASSGEKTWRMTETPAVFKYDFDSGASFYSYDSGDFFFCTKDGVKYCSSNGTQKWDSIINLSAPVMSAQNGVVAVGEARGHIVTVFDSTGKLYDQRFEEPVLYFSVNKTGFLSVILQNGSDGYIIEVFARNQTGQPWRYNFYDPNIYPVSADVSADGRIVAIIFADVTFTLTTRLQLAFRNEAEGRDYTDSIFAEHTYDGEMPAAVRFMEGNRLLVFTDARIGCLQIGADGGAAAVAEKWDIIPNNRIDAVAFYGDKYFAYSVGDALLNRAGEAPGTVTIVSADGTQTGSYATGKKINLLSFGFDTVLAGTGRDFFAIDKNGSLLWEYNMPQEARQMIFLDNTNTVLAATDISGNVMKRVKSAN